MGCAVAVYILYSLPSIVTANRIAYVYPAGTRYLIFVTVTSTPCESSAMHGIMSCCM